MTFRQISFWSSKLLIDIERSFDLEDFQPGELSHPVKWNFDQLSFWIWVNDFPAKWAFGYVHFQPYYLSTELMNRIKRKLPASAHFSKPKLVNLTLINYYSNIYAYIVKKKSNACEILWFIPSSTSNSHKPIEIEEVPLTSHIFKMKWIEMRSFSAKHRKQNSI